MPTQLDNTWLPGAEKETDIIIGGWMGTSKISKEVLEILSAFVYRGSRGKGKNIETTPQVYILNDSHSNLTSDDLLWYIKGMPNNETGILKSIKIKGNIVGLYRE